ncbi:hypothetical protein [Paraburkholderia fungorum]|uniref:hypothetical protein n=1 Tax=Paraburkholderia fungorum TaxID=134537 RepID=UPI001C1F1A2E|nr:hypothetical protein [Paraburkholderia fungorum]MBU7436773.1 hypothetical protein [Paraburkholderia fungorum]
MSTFKWIEYEEELTARVKVPVSVLALLKWIPGELSLKDSNPDSGLLIPSFDDLERAAEFAREQRRKSPIRSGVDAIVQQIETLPKDDPWTGYPEQLPKNVAFVLVAYSLLLIDQSIGHFSENEHPLAFGAMAEACHAMHTAGYYYGAAVGVVGGQIANSSKASKAAHARNAENRAIKSEAFKWLAAHRHGFKSKEKAAEGLIRIEPIAFRTALRYVNEFDSSSP